MVLALAYLTTGILVITAVMAGLLYRRRYRQHVLHMQYSETFTVHHNNLHHSNRPLIRTGTASTSASASGTASGSGTSPENAFSPEDAEDAEDADEAAQQRSRASPTYRAALEAAHSDWV